MSLVLTTLRRSLWLLLIGAVGGVAWSWWSDRNAPPSPTTPPEWPPLDTQTATAAMPTSVSSTRPAPDSMTSASIVNALIDSPDARSAAGTGDWVTPDDHGACPLSHPIKANDNSGIFHVPGGRFYERTNAERCYATPEAAAADGYRQAKN